MDSEALRTFVAIHRACSFSGAAAQLHRSQPAISRRIALLERELGASLFERTAGGVVLSQAGLVLLPYAERALAALQDAANAVDALQSGDSGPVSIAVVGTLASTSFAVTLNRFATEFPDVDVSLRTATSIEVSELVRRGQVTIGLRYFDDPSSDLTCTTVCNEKLLVVCARKHRLAGRTVRSLRNLKDERWLAFPETSGHRETATHTIQAQFRSRGVEAIHCTPVDSLTAQKRLIEAGFGIALMQQSAIKEERSLKTLTIIKVADLDAANPVSVIVRRNGYLSRASRRLLEVLKATKF
jgi:DNA-binding transcriptional LysR family regulator